MPQIVTDSCEHNGLRPVTALQGFSIFLQSLLRPGMSSGSTLSALTLLCLLLAGCAAKPFAPSTSSSSQGLEQRERPQPEPLTVAQRSRFNEAKSAFHADNSEAAITKLEALREIRPHYAIISSRLGFLFQQLNHKSQAVAAYRRALADDPGEPMALNNLALLYQDEGRFKESRKLLEAGLKWHPDSPSLHYNMAVLAELYLLNLPLALNHYQRYESLAEKPKPAVAGWIADLKRRIK